MRRLTYYVAVSLDGYIAGPDHEIDVFAFPPALVDHVVEEYPETLPAPLRAQLGIAERPNRRFDAVIMGRHTYELGARQGLTDPYPHLDQTVVSRSLAPGDGPTVTDDVVGTVRRLLETDGLGLWLCGGGVLASSLADRIDELVLKRQPLILGAGRPLFAGSYEPRGFTLVERNDVDGVVVERYVRRTP